MPNRTRLPVALLLAAAMLVAACGQKGPLYLPENETATDAAAEDGDEERSAAGDTNATE